MSTTEFEALEANRVLTIRGENFVTQDLEYIKQLAARHPDKYQVFVEFQMQAGTQEQLIANGARDASNLVKEAYGELPQIKSGMKDVIHIKGEGTTINYGLREGSKDVFNDRIIDFKIIPKGPL
jgi:hypothetical protein